MGGLVLSTGMPKKTLGCSSDEELIAHMDILVLITSNILLLYMNYC